jgi:putative DNA primase/helicase
MTDRKLVVSFGSGVPRPNNAQFAYITHVNRVQWDEVVALFIAQPPVSADKSSAGWYAFAEFDPVYRDSDNLVARHALTFDYDHVTPADVKTIRAAYAELEYVIYTTASHTAEHPRLRVILPLSRPAGYDEFQAVSRMVASKAGIELASRETHVPAQMMYLPTVKPGQKYSAKRNAGEWVDVEAVLAEYADWTDRTQWPKRKEADGVHAVEGERVAPTKKPGIIGAFNRAFTISQAIEKFNLPFEKVR